MGLGDIIGRVLTEYKADVSDHKAKIKELSGEQKKQAQESLKGIEAQNKSLENHIKFLGKVTMAVGGVAAAFSIAQSGIKEFAEGARLSAGAAGVNIDALAKASRGLRNEDDLMKIAAAGSRGVWKLNTAQIAEVTKAMLALRKEGHEDAKVLEIITDTLQKGTTEGLKKFGIVIKQSDDASENMKNTIAALSAETAKFGGNLDLAGDNAVRAAVQMENAFDQVKSAIGEASIALIDFVRRAAEGAAIWHGGLSWEDQVMIGQGKARDARAQQLMKSRGGTMESARQGVATEDAALSMLRSAGTKFGDLALAVEGAGRISGGDWTNKAALLEAVNVAVARQLQDVYSRGASKGIDGPSWLAKSTGSMLESGRRAKWGKTRKAGGRGGAEADEWSLVDRAGVLLDNFTDAAGRYGAEQGDPGAAGSAGGSWDENFGYAKRQFGQFDKDMAQMASDQNQSKLEQIFGPVSDFDAYATGFNLLTTAVTAGFDAWMTGAVGVGEAMKMAVAGFAKSLASEALMQALRHGAYALGSLAFGDVKGATVHGIAAAKWGGVAVAAGIAAKGLGGGAPSAGAGAAGGYRASGGGADSGPRSSVVIIGDVASDSSNRRKGREHRRLTDLAEKYAPPTGSYSR